MAERNHLKIASQNDIADDDPFAELTKIMGFDPREPSRPQSVQDSRDMSGGDFDIDLEKELMGEFDAFDDAPAEPAAPAYGRQEPAALDAPAMDAAEEDDLSLSLNDAFLLDEPAEAPAAAHGDPAFGAFPLSDAERAAAGAVEDDFEDAVAKSFEADFDQPAEQPLRFEDEQDAAFDAQPLTETDEQAVEPVTGEASDDDFDAAIFDDLELDAEPAENLEMDAQAVARQGGAFSADEDSLSLDDAMADVEMDFDMPSLEPADAPAAVVGETVDEEAPLAADAGSAEIADDFDLGMDLDDAFAGFEGAELDDRRLDAPAMSEPVQAAAPAHIAPAVPAPREVAPAQDTSLEDELNALLNRMSARPLAQPDVPAAAMAVPQETAAPAATEGDPIDDFDAASWDLDIAAEEAGQQQDEMADDIDPALLADLEAVDFSDMEIGAPEAEDTGDATAWQAEAADMDAAEAQDDADFDANDFDAELDKHFGSLESVAPAVASAAAVSAAAIPGAWQASAQPRADHSWQAQGAASPSAPVAAAATTHPASGARAYRHEDIPDVETIDVPERVVALADDLDLPEVAFEEPRSEAAPYDDLDAEFNSILNEMNAVEPASAAATSSYEAEAYGSAYQRGATTGAYAAAPTAAAASRPAPHDPLADFDLDAFGASNAVADDDAFDYDPDLDQQMDIAAANDAEQAKPRNRLLLWAGAVAAIAVVGGAGAFALSFGGGGGNEAPAIVKADNQPIKVKPENPGGTVIPNQDNKVYDAVSKGSTPSAPSQQELVTNTEEPVDVTAKAEPRVVGADARTDEAAAPTGKSEDRIEQVLQEDAANEEQETALVTPRKVRTMVVRPDGSLVPREDPAPAPVSASEPADPAPQLVASVPDATGAVNPQGNVNELQPVAPQGETPAAPTAAATPEAAGQSTLTPSVAPVAPQRPSDQPIDVVGEVKPDQVAAIDTASSAAASGAWSMQIASQPTADAAQSTYQDLARRYSSVLNGRGVNIVKAEIAGKGTFYRVRVPAKSRNDAVELCSSYKAAGGNCFVSK